MTEQLKEWASEYVVAKATEGKLKKQIENLNANIKQSMELDKLNEVELDDGAKVCYSITKRESLDEDKLLVQLKKYAPNTQCIKTKEYIDMDILESEIYHDKLSSEALAAMDTCRNVKEIPTLTIKKAKKGK